MGPPMIRQVLLGTLTRFFRGRVSSRCAATSADAAHRLPGMDSQMQAVRLAAFQDGLRALGYIEGRNIAIEYRWAEGRFDRLPELASQLVALNVDVIVTAAPPSVRAAQRASSNDPDRHVRARSGGNGVRGKPCESGRKHYGDRFPGLGAVRQAPGAVAADGPEARPRCDPVEQGRRRYRRRTGRRERCTHAGASGDQRWKYASRANSPPQSPRRNRRALRAWSSWRRRSSPSIAESCWICSKRTGCRRHANCASMSSRDA